MLLGLAARPCAATCSPVYFYGRTICIVFCTSTLEIRPQAHCGCGSLLRTVQSSSSGYGVPLLVVDLTPVDAVLPLCRRIVS